MLQKFYVLAPSTLTGVAPYLPYGCPICFDLCVIDVVITQSTD